MTIEGNDPGLVVSVADDAFHPPTSDDPTWIETAWLPFWLTDGDVSVHVRLWWRPNEAGGLQGGAVTAWRGENRYLAHDAWSEPFDGPPDLTDLHLANGLRWQCLTPLHTYRLRHTSARVELDITFTALMEPNPVDPAESSGMFAGHLEQPGRVTGRVRLGDRWSDVDCATVRDRSWGPRTMRPGLRLGNAHGTSSAGRAFFAYVNPDADGRELVTSGYHLADGRAARLVSGERFTTYDGDAAVALRVDAVDALGRSLVADGECRNRQAVDAGNDLYAVLNLVRWTVAAPAPASGAAPDSAPTTETTTEAWGENHDIWSKADWIAAGRAPLSAR